MFEGNSSQGHSHIASTVILTTEREKLVTTLCVDVFEGLETDAVLTPRS